mgnify:CR=1 FL=1
MRGLQLIATGGGKPGRVVTNEELSHQVDTSECMDHHPHRHPQRRTCTDEEDAATLPSPQPVRRFARSGLPGGYCLLRCCHPLLPHCRAERGHAVVQAALHPAGKPPGL